MRQERILGIGLGTILAGGLATSAPAALVDGLESIEAARWRVALPQTAGRILAHTELDLAPTDHERGDALDAATEAFWAGDAPAFATTIPVAQCLAAADLMLLPRMSRMVAPADGLVVQLH